MNIKLCNKCKGFNKDKIIRIIDKNFNDIKYVIGCTNTCGIGRNKIAILVDDKLIIANDEEELIKKMKEII